MLYSALNCALYCALCEALYCALYYNIDKYKDLSLTIIYMMFRSKADIRSDPHYVLPRSSHIPHSHVAFSTTSCSMWGGSMSLSPACRQACSGRRLLILISYYSNMSWGATSVRMWISRMRINMQSLITRAETEPRLHKNTAEITVFVFSAVLHFIILNADNFEDIAFFFF